MDSELKKAWEIMETRTQYVRMHAELTQEIFGMWAEAMNTGLPKDWYYVSKKIHGTINLIDSHHDMFPNWAAHLDTWRTLKELARTLSHNA